MGYRRIYNFKLRFTPKKLCLKRWINIMLLHVILQKLLILTSYLNEHSKYEYVQNSAVITKDSIDGTLYNFKLRFTPEDGYA